MALEVEYITLGDASSRLGVPAPTLRHWTDQMEEFNVHFVLRNQRNERIYEESDLKVFEFLRDLKEEYGRRTTTKDLGYMIVEKGRVGELKLRSKEDAPQAPNPSNRTADLLNQDDIKQLMQSERVRQVIGVIVAETTKNLKDDLIEEVRETVKAELLESKTQEQLSLEEMERKRIEREEEMEKRRIEREEEMERKRIEREEERAKYIEERAQMREERDRKARIEWEEKQEAKAKEEREQQSIEEKPKSWIQKIFGQ